MLLIDDCAFNVVAIQGLLQQFQFESDYCLDGSDAVNAIKQRIEAGVSLYKLLLVDYSMPGKDGPTCIEAIQKMVKEAGLAD